MDKLLPYLTRFAVALVVFVIGYVLIKLLDIAIRKAFAHRQIKNLLLVKFVCSVVNKSSWAILIVMVLGQLGVEVAPLIASIGVTGFILGFAFQESLSNLAAGMMIALNNPFNIGDYIKTAALEGTVVEVNMMATVLVTNDDKRIVIPNKSVWGGPIINHSALTKGK